MDLFRVARFGAPQELPAGTTFCFLGFRFSQSPVLRGEALSGSSLRGSGVSYYDISQQGYTQDRLPIVLGITRHEAMRQASGKSHQEQGNKRRVRPQAARLQHIY